MSHTRKFIVIAVMAFAALLAGCNLLFPEKMDADIDINSDWTYEIEFTGILTDYFTRSTRLEKGSLTPEELESMNDLEQQLKSDHRFRSVKYLGDERYKVEFRETGVLQGETDLINGDYFAKVLSITPKPDNHVLIEGVEFKDEAEKVEAKRTMEKYGIGIDWRIRIHTDAEVVAHNAETTPWLFGLLGAYEWHITSLDDPAPLMVLKM
jgi:hypothetical protein